MAWTRWDNAAPEHQIKNIQDQLDILSSGGVAGTLAHAVTQVLHGFTVGQAVRFNGGQYVVAEGDSGADADVDGLVSAVSDANSFTIQIGGYITGLSGLVAGSDYFLSATTPGGLTATEPSSAGQVSKPLLHADSTTSGYLINMRGLVIPAASITYITIQLVDESTSVTTGEGKAHYTITALENGKSLVTPAASCAVAPTGTGLSFGIRKNSTEMLSTNVTVDTTKTTSDQSAVQPVVKSDGSQVVATGDIVWVDCDQADSNSASRAATVRLAFQ